MAYEPTVWKANDVITSAKLNKLEQGVANSVLVVETNNGSLNKTWKQIHDAGFAVVHMAGGDVGVLSFCNVVDNEYCVNFIGEGGPSSYSALTEDGYPTNHDNDTIPK